MREARVDSQRSEAGNLFAVWGGRVLFVARKGCPKGRNRPLSFSWSAMVRGPEHCKNLSGFMKKSECNRVVRGPPGTRCHYATFWKPKCWASSGCSPRAMTTRLVQPGHQDDRSFRTQTPTLCCAASAVAASWKDGS